MCLISHCRLHDNIRKDGLVQSRAALDASAAIGDSFLCMSLLTIAARWKVEQRGC